MGGVDVVCMKGRGHYYEHGSMKVMTTPVFCLLVGFLIDLWLIFRANTLFYNCSRLQPWGVSYFISIDRKSVV